MPVNPDALGMVALVSRPRIEHLTKDIAGFYIPSFSCRLISYKALAMPAARRAFYLDVENPDYQVAIALGQPFRMMWHNGEINTVEGNRNWMTSREEFFASPDQPAPIHFNVLTEKNPLPEPPRPPFNERLHEK